MMNTLYLPELREMLEQGDRDGLHEFCTALHPARTAEFMEGLSPAESWAVLAQANAATRVEIFRYLDHEKQLEIIETCDPEAAGQLLAAMPADDRVDLINAADASVVSEVLPLVPAEERREILRLQSYPEGTAGAVMTTEVAKLPEALSVRAALDEISRQAEHLETIYYIYIVDDQDHLRGAISARQLVTHLGKPNMPIHDLMERDLVTVEATDDQEAVARKVADYDFHAIPVVDHEQHLLGIITHDDVIDVLQAEATEDAYLAGAVGPLEEGYLATSWVLLMRLRAGWLALLFGGAMLTILALQSYHEALNSIGWLVLFLPLVVSSGGNSGSQSATLIIRALTTHEVTPAVWWAIVRREFFTGAALGLVLGSIGYLAACFFATPLEALVLPVTLILVVICGTLIGSVLPLVFARLGLDPALMSTPFVTVIIDVLGILIYMNVAILMLDELRT
jgi:magnesium transporter